MSVDELILYSAKEVRANPDLFKEYIRLYTEEIGKKPNCATCQFSGTYERWVGNHSTASKKLNKMSNNTFTLIKTKRAIVVPFTGGQVINEDATDDLVRLYLDQVQGAARVVREANFTKLPDEPKAVEISAVPKAKRPRKKVRNGKG